MAIRFAVVLASVATLILTYSLLVGDFSLDYVARTTSRATPWPYRVSALWGGMEGSLLFYAALLLWVGTLGVRRRGRVEHVVVAVTGLGLLLLTALASNPFTRLAIPAVDGEGLLAILQHPAMIYHPPILYLGLTTLIVPFAITAGAVVRRNLSNRWLADARRTLTFSWVLLTFGMVAGANWAYIELGWGGFWAWDSVENTALMPWLAATVYLHTSRVTERDGRLLRWTAFFAMFPFALGVLGVYLTRSGVTGSIHSFAEDPVIGKTLLISALVVAAVVIALTFGGNKGRDWGEPGTGRDTWLAASGFLVAASLMFVLVGSAYPAYLQVFGGASVVVDTRFFVSTVSPVALVIAVLIGFALDTTWSRAGMRPVDLIVFGSASGLAVLIALTLGEETPPAGVALVGLATGALAVMVLHASTGRLPRLIDPARLAHLGMAMVLVGAGGSSLGAEFTGPMSVGETVDVGSHSVELVSVSTGEANRYIYVEGVFIVDGNVELTPQIRAYEAQGIPVSEPALRSTPLSDIIVAVSVLSPDLDGFEVSVFVRPMVWWVWVGALVISLAGATALAWRDGVGGERRREARAALPPAGTTSGTTGR